MTHRKVGRPKQKSLTESQSRALKAIRSLIQTRDLPPTLDEIARKMRLNQSSARYLVEVLHRKGFIRRKKRTARSIALTGKKEE